jgi:hypothetical protein
MNKKIVKAIEEDDVARHHWVAKTSHQANGQILREKLILENVNITDFLAEVDALDVQKWDKHPRNKLKIQRNTEAIGLVDSKQAPLGVSHVRDVQEYRLSPEAKNFPKIMKWLRDFAIKEGGGTLARAMIIRLKPKEQVYKHHDMGLYYFLRDRYHLVLRSQGSRIKVDGHESIWHAGEVHWFNNKMDHESFNDSDEYRTHVIFDVLPDTMKKWAEICK